MDISISILICSYNTPKIYLYECIESIVKQKNIGDINIEIVWINDGSDQIHTEILEEILHDILDTCPNIRLVYKKLLRNMGIAYCLHEGTLLCSNELIFRMDSDDIMLENRIRKQYEFMQSTPDCVLCGTNIMTFVIEKDLTKSMLYPSDHPEVLTWEEYLQDKKTWIMNHPTLCFRKSSIITIGNYNKHMKLPFEDLELELRVLKHYGKIYNIPDVLLHYRIHCNQYSRKLARNGETELQAFIDDITK